MEGTTEKQVSPPGERYRWVCNFAIGGDLRFISHHDTLRLFRRALARAEIPLKYSEGFNPHPRIMIPLPRPVGIASRAEALVMETDRDVDPDAALQRLRLQTPQDMELISLRRLERGEQLEPQRVRYRLDLSETEWNDLNDRVQRLVAAPNILVQRKNPKDKQVREVDIRPYLLDITVSGRHVEFTTKITGSGTVKPAEVAAALGCDVASINHRIDRLEIQWSSTPVRT